MILSREKLQNWLDKNNIKLEQVKRYCINGIDYLFATMQDGYIAIFECLDTGYFVAKIQAVNIGKAFEWCGMVEQLNFAADRIC